MKPGFTRTNLLTSAIVLASAYVTTPAMAADTYVIDASHTQVFFIVERFGFNNTIGSFTDVKGTLVLDEDNPANSSVNVKIKTNSLWSGHAEREKHVKGKFWLNVEEFPTITFTSTKVILDGEKNAKVTGDLTIWGKTQPAVLDVTLNKIGMDRATKKNAAGFSAMTKINRSDYGHTIAAPMVGDEVMIKIEALSHLQD